MIHEREVKEYLYLHSDPATPSVHIFEMIPSHDCPNGQSLLPQTVCNNIFPEPCHKDTCIGVCVWNMCYLAKCYTEGILVYCYYAQNQVFLTEYALS